MAGGFQQGAFHGTARAADREFTDGSRRQLVGLDIAGNKPAHNSLLYTDDSGKREIGSVTSAIWSPTCKRNIALAIVDAPHFQDRLDGLGGNLLEPGTRMGASDVASAGCRASFFRA